MLSAVGGVAGASFQHACEEFEDFGAVGFEKSPIFISNEARCGSDAQLRFDLRARAHRDLVESWGIFLTSPFVSFSDVAGH